jgi:energy-coupling factor transport system permease protein
MPEHASLHVRKSSGLHRLHPLTKLALAAFTLVAGLAIPGMLTGYVILLVILIPLAAWGRITREFLKWIWRLVLPFAISVFLVQGLFWTGGTPVLELGPISFKQEGLQFAVRSTGRILAVIGGMLLLAMDTRPDALMISLNQRGVPASLSYIVLTAIQVVPRFQTKAATILDAQRSRGLETEGNYFIRARALLPLIGPLVIGSLLEVEERAIALEARAFKRKGPKTSLLLLRDSAAQQIVRKILIIALPLLVFGRLAWALRR